MWPARLGTAHPKPVDAASPLVYPKQDFRLVDRTNVDGPFGIWEGRQWPAMVEVAAEETCYH